MNSLNERFLELVHAYEDLKSNMEKVRNELNQIMLELKVGTYLQDSVTGAVYKIVKPNGTFMYYRDIDFVRTALPGEDRGTLSKKEAQEMGFILRK